jgi:hypothetical protein
MNTDKLNENIEKLALHFEKANFAEYIELLSRPWKLFWLNFCVGLFRGFGTAVGMTVVFAIIVYALITVLKHFIDIPIIGSYIAALVEFVNQALSSKAKP